MKKLIVAAGAAALLAASSMAALADDATGTITSIDAANAAVTLSDGKVYFLPQNLASASAMWKVGDKVTITYSADQSGKMNATAVTPAA